jgi:hypothetical protein
MTLINHALKTGEAITGEETCVARAKRAMCNRPLENGLTVEWVCEQIKHSLGKMVQSEKKGETGTSLGELPKHFVSAVAWKKLVDDRSIGQRYKPSARIGGVIAFSF